ncbi:MAG TPA: general secretion pathway protein GspK [Gammaproteobacteria bacterium]|nr:general secretion pathway protein GspK [Gammaproteobacteria bacterium]
MTHTRQQGVALITALLVVAIATVAAVSMATRQQLDIRRTASLLHSEQAWAYVLGAESWARVILMRDKQDGNIDTLSEDWATRPPVSVVEGGTIQGRILDMQGRFNVNSLVVNGEPDKDNIDRYKRLLRLLDLDEALVDPLVDWIDANIDVRFPDGAEDEAYLLLPVPYRAANRPLVDISELRLVQGYEPEVLAKLQPFVSALPEPTAININTASAEVLSILAENMSLADGEALVEARGEEGYTKVDSLSQQPALNGKQQFNPGTLSVETKWFLLVSEANIGQGRARLASLIQRGDQAARVVRRQREFAELVVAPVKEETTTGSAATN